MGGPMNDLIERIEAASGPDRELDADIGRAVGWVQKCGAQWGIGAPHWWLGDKCQAEIIGWWHSGNTSSLPPFTASIDAALTLVPEGFEWSLEYQAGHHVSSDVECMVAIAKLGDPCRDWESESYTPALALCAAALKARAYLKETNNGQ